MPTLEVHEHADGSYTVKNAHGHVVHEDVPAIVDVDPYWAMSADLANDLSGVVEQVMDEPEDIILYRLPRKRWQKGQAKAFSGKHKERRAKSSGGE